MIYYSGTTGGFYNPSIHGDAIPADAVEIGATEHAALMAAQASGKVITADADGRPAAVDPPPPTTDELWSLLRAERDRRLAASDIMVLPDRWAGYTEDQRAAWTSYRQALRDLPAITTDPTNPAWPEVPQ